MAGVICNRRVLVEIKGKLHKDSSEISYVVWLGDSGTDKKTGDGA